MKSVHGLLVRAFECPGPWETMLQDGRDDGSRQIFDPARHGDRLLRLSLEANVTSVSGTARTTTSSSSGAVGKFIECASHELSSASSLRPTTALRSDVVDPEYPVFANSFGLTLRSSTTRVAGAHAFDAWSRGRRPLCEELGINESRHAAHTLEVVGRNCAAATIAPDPDATTAYKYRHGSALLALEHKLAISLANCRFRTVESMLAQQAKYRQLVRSSTELLARCPSAAQIGRINQVAATYGRSDVTGVYYLSWVASHMPLARLAFKWPTGVVWVRLSRGKRVAAGAGVPPRAAPAPGGARPARAGDGGAGGARVGMQPTGQQHLEQESISCSCHE